MSTKRGNANKSTSVERGEGVGESGLTDGEV